MSINLTDQTFANTIQSNLGLTLVDFWAEWCGPCKRLLPVIEEISQNMKNINVCKVNVDECPEVSSEFGIRSIPTLMLFKDGKLIDTKVGGLPKSEITSWINSKQ